MAITKFSIIVDPRGSMDGITFSRNRGGSYMRARVVPTNPNTVYQQIVRSSMAQLASRWNDTLTPVQRVAWDTYAANVLLPNKHGDMINVGGVGMYMRSNIPRMQIGIGIAPIVDAAPTTFDLGELGGLSITSITAATKIAVIQGIDTDDWMDEVGSHLICYDSKSQNPAINYFKGPYNFNGTIEGDDIAPPTSPLNFTLFNLPVVGNQTFLRLRVSRADGRLSADFRDGKLAI